jgi:carotenoid cleavage dioxygenase-like enzyme
MIHDFKVTRRYAVFFVAPARLRLDQLLIMSSPFDDWFKSDPSTPSMIFLADLQGPRHRAGPSY